MRSRLLTAASLALLACGLCGAARAADLQAGPSFADAEWGPWEFGVDGGAMIPTRKATFSRTIDNQRAYDLLAAESVGDEVGEGWKAPPLPGSSVVAGTLKPLGAIGLHVYRRFNPWLAWGVDGAYGFKRDVRIDSRGIYLGNNFMKVAYRSNLAYFAFPAKLGPTLGPIRPYLLAGPGAYLVQQRAEISFTDADDAQLKPVGIIQQDTFRFGLAGGIGVEWRAPERGLISLDVQYHKVFAARDRVDFLEPKLRLSVRF